MAEVAAAGLVAAAVFGVLGPWPQQQADRLREAAGEWQEQVFGADQPVCDPVPMVLGVAAPTAALEPLEPPNSFLVTVTGAECAWIDLDIAWSLDLRARWEFDGSHIPEIRVEQVWAARDMDAPWTLTAVGPGGVAVVQGKMHLQESD
ncbi:MAG: hypothetical protein F4217_08120 [Acidimicrobiaceae bacterium]|nr:hypothetical protein [Acidimicrobiaceae bacterium]